MFTKSLVIAATIATLSGTIQVASAGPSPVAPKFTDSTLLLPNGDTLTTNGTHSQASWNGVKFYTVVLGVPTDHPYGQSVVGNHSQILSPQWIQTPYGRAWFALNERTPPAASGQTGATYEYWVAMNRPTPSSGGSVDYCIEAFVSGSRAHARAAMMEVMNQWIVPFSAEPDAKPPVSVTIAPSVGHRTLARGIQSYLINVANSSVYQHFTILTLTYIGTKFGHPEWQVKLNVRHKPGHTSPFDNGVNERYVTFIQRNNQDYVFGLATGM